MIKSLIEKKSHIFFDVDWVLVSSIPFYADLVRTTLTSLWAKLPDNIDHLLWLDHDLYLQDFFPRKKIEYVKNELNKIFSLSKNHRPDLTRCAIDTLKTLKNKWKKLAVISSRSRGEMDWLFEHYRDFHDLFDVNISATEVSKIKPDPEPMIKALSFYWINSKDAVFIWDSIHDYWAAKNTDLDFIWVCSWILKESDWKKLKANFLQDIWEIWDFMTE